MLLCFGPFLPSSFCLDDSWILCRSCIDKDIHADTNSKQYLALGIVQKQLPADMTLQKCFVELIYCTYMRFPFATYELTARLFHNYTECCEEQNHQAGHLRVQISIMAPLKQSCRKAHVSSNSSSFVSYCFEITPRMEYLFFFKVWLRKQEISPLVEFNIISLHVVIISLCRG